MNYSDGVRVCTPCLEGTSEQTKFIKEEYHEDTQCIFCGSYNTKEQFQKWSYYQCLDCGETFRRL